MVHILIVVFHCRFLKVKIDLSSYQTPDSLTQTDNIKQCSGQGIYVLTDGEPNKNSGSQNLMQSALSNKGSSFSCANTDDGWDCIHKFALKLLDATANPLGLKIRTAVVGFGSEFNDSPSYNKTLTQAQNIANLGTIDTNAKKLLIGVLLEKADGIQGQVLRIL